MEKKISQIMFEQSSHRDSERHRRWVIAKHPIGEPTLQDFLFVEDTMPLPPPGQYLARVIWLSIDPKQRLLMNPNPRNVEILPLLGTMFGYGVGEVVASNHEKFQVGDIVQDLLGWQSYALMDGAGHYVNNPYGTRVVNQGFGPISTALGVLGNGGLTAYFSVLRELKPKSGETILVSSAAGNVGSIAGQIAKIHGCRVIGLTSTDGKCESVISAFGFDDCINYRSEADLAAAIRRAAPDGIDMYYDNVGGAISRTVSSVLNAGARVTIVGYTTSYNTIENGKPWSWPSDQARSQFIYHDYHKEFDDALAQIADWIRGGQIRYREDVVEGLENAPAALLSLLAGQNIGKRIVRIGPNPEGVK